MAIAYGKTVIGNRCILKTVFQDKISLTRR